MYARPVSLVREKETRDSVTEHFKPYMDELAKCEHELVPITNDCTAQVVTDDGWQNG